MEVCEFKNLVWMLARTIYEDTNSAFAPIFEEHGLTTLQARIVLALHLHQELTVGSIAGCVCMAEANVSAMCKKLESQALLLRFRDLKDERMVRVTLSAQGEEVARALDKAMNEKITRCVRGDAGERFHAIITGLQKLNDMLQIITQDSGEEHSQ